MSLNGNLSLVRIASRRGRKRFNENTQRPFRDPLDILLRDVLRLSVLGGVDHVVVYGGQKDLKRVGSENAACTRLSATSRKVHITPGKTGIRMIPPPLQRGRLDRFAAR